MKATLALAIVSLLIVAAHAEPDPASRCAGAKIKAAARKTAAKLKCQARAAAHAGPVDVACLGKAETKFSAAWARIEAEGGCNTLNDEAAIEAKVDAYVEDLVGELSVTVTTTTAIACTTSTSFPPCVNQNQFCSSFSFGCPGGQTCTADVSGCICVGPPPPCGNAGVSFCAVGVCPGGQTCTVVNGVCGPIGCACQ
jgi:hypothetical protein